MDWNKRRSDRGFLTERRTGADGSPSVPHVGSLEGGGVRVREAAGKWRRG